MPHLPAPSLLARGVAALLTAAPGVAVLRILATTGADTPSNDYVFSVELVVRALTGSYDWTRFLHDSFLTGSHCMAVPLLARIALAALTGWSVSAELALVFALFVLRLLLLHDLLTHRTPERRGLWLWPLLGALVFAVSQIEVFAYGDAGLQVGFVQLGFTLGLWGLVRWPGRLRGACTAAAGGLLSAFSGGGGVLAGPVLLAGCLADRRTPRSHRILLAACAAMGGLPYAAYFAAPGDFRNEVTRFRLLPPDPVRIVGAIGAPLTSATGSDFSPNPPQLAVGLCGALLIAVGIGLLWRRRKSDLPQAAMPALLLLLWGLAGTVALVVLRDGMRTWYSTTTLGIWVGLVGLAHTAGSRVLAGRSPQGPDGWERRAVLAWSVGVPAFVIPVYLASNTHFEDHVMWLLPSRSPAAAAALRHADRAPNYAEEALFPGSTGYAGWYEQLARPLAAHGLGPFRSRQQWTLQGEFLLDSVRVHERRGSADVTWISASRSPGDRAAPARWSDYQHRTLRVPASNSVTWRVELPGSLRDAQLRLQAGIAASPDPRTAAQVWVHPEGGSKRLALEWIGPGTSRWQSRKLSLSEYAGRTVTLRFTAAGAGVAVFRYPVLDVSLRAPERWDAPLVLRPPNVDPPGRLPAYIFPLEPLVELEAASHGPGPDAWTTVAIPQGKPRSLACPEPVLLADYSHLRLKLAVDPPQRLYAVRLLLGVQPGSGGLQEHQVVLPLTPDGAAHVYTYDLKLLELDQQARLKSIRLVSKMGVVRLHELGLAARDRSSPPWSPDGQRASEALARLSSRLNWVRSNDRQRASPSGSPFATRPRMPLFRP